MFGIVTITTAIKLLVFLNCTMFNSFLFWILDFEIKLLFPPRDLFPFLHPKNFPQLLGFYPQR